MTFCTNLLRMGSVVCIPPAFSMGNSLISPMSVHPVGTSWSVPFKDFFSLIQWPLAWASVSNGHISCFSRSLIKVFFSSCHAMESLNITLAKFG